jgi:urea transport system ATP-binding protein
MTNAATVLERASRRMETAPKAKARISRWPAKVQHERAARARAHSPTALLCVDDISVSFDGFRALSDLTLILNDGELRCIIGPNGAGKTTLMDVITGKTKPDLGAVFFVHDLEDLTSLSEHQIASKGIGRKFQRPTVFPSHSVRENIELALAANKGVFSSLFTAFSKLQRMRIEECLERVGLTEKATCLASTLSHGEKQWLEIGMLLSQDPKVLLVDEPVAGMTGAEADKTAALLRSLRGRHTVIVVEHDMDFVRSLDSDCVTVLHEGKVLAEGSLSTVQADRRVIEVYLGE